ncbi:MAG: penicillin-binding protein 2 [Candidatus Beckwithbacteria bacterium]
MNSNWRLNLLSFFFAFIFLIIISRLFYWQILAGASLAVLAQTQQQTSLELPAKRGEILAADNSFIVANQPAYFSYLNRQNQPLVPDLASRLAPIIYNQVTLSATPSALLSSAEQKQLIVQAQTVLQNRFDDFRLTWIPLARKLTLPLRWQLEALNISNLFFEEEQVRLYPEASMAAHLVGFVGSNEQGNDVGLYGLEGFYQSELAGRPGLIVQEKDAFNQPILTGWFQKQNQKDGRQLQLHLNKSLQFLVEKKLASALDRYGAKAGSVAIMDPYTGAILAMSSLPGYDPAEFTRYDPSLYLNPVISAAFEPGSIFKVFVMAAALEEKAIKSDTICDICAGPVKIDKYTINTWDDKYRPNSGITDILVNSDNVGMVFVGQKLGLDKYLDYFHRFGFTESTGIDLQDESTPEAKADKDWTYVDLATASFGQGFVVTSLQLLQAVSAIANGGELVTPKVVDKVISADKILLIPPKIKHRVISPETAELVTEMMVAAAKTGEAKWANVKGYRIAGKTGTAQVAVGGQYAREKTNASFIGFAPADNPKFAMLVTLKEPQTSPWASETAAPLWFSLAQDLLNHFNILPDNY